MTTSDLEFFLPGIEAYYGADRPIDLHFNVTEIGDIGIIAADSEMDGEGTLVTQFWVEMVDGSKELATEITFSQTTFGFTVLVNDMAVSLQIAQVHSANVTIDSCTFGTLSPLKIKLELNNFLLLYMGHINNWLAGLPIVIPSQIGNIFTLSNLTIEYFDDYIYAGATPTFIAPAADPTLIAAFLQ